MLNTGNIQKMTSNLVAKIDMQYVDPSDFWDVLAAVKETVESNSDYLLPDICNLPTFLAGIIVGQAMYECTIVKELNEGKHSDQIIIGAEND